MLSFRKSAYSVLRMIPWFQARWPLERPFFNATVTELEIMSAITSLISTFSTMRPSSWCFGKMAQQVRVPRPSIRSTRSTQSRSGTTQGPTKAATVGFSDLHYQELQSVSPVSELSREQLIEHAVEERKAGQVLLYRKRRLSCRLLTRERGHRLLPSSCRSDDRMCWRVASVGTSHWR
jgi:hypothetical protein